MGLRGDRQERIRELGKVFLNQDTESEEIVGLYDWWCKHYDQVRKIKLLTDTQFHARGQC